MWLEKRLFHAKHCYLAQSFVGGATVADAKELVQYTRELHEAVLSWLKKEHPSLHSKKM